MTPGSPDALAELLLFLPSSKESFYSCPGSESRRCLLCVQLERFSSNHIGGYGQWNEAKPRWSEADSERLSENSGTSEWPLLAPHRVSRHQVSAGETL